MCPCGRVCKLKLQTQSGGETAFSIFLLCRIQLRIKNHELLLMLLLEAHQPFPSQQLLTSPWCTVADVLGLSLPPSQPSCLVYPFGLNSTSGQLCRKSQEGLAATFLPENKSAQPLVLFNIRKRESLLIAYFLLP